MWWLFGGKPTPVPRPICALLSHMADLALSSGVPKPVITIDGWAGYMLADAVGAEVGCGWSDLIPHREPGLIMMYDGIKVVARREQICKHEVDGWREHFGPLADIWS